MANNSADSIRTAIVTHLSTVAELKQVVAGRSMDPSLGFPFARVYLAGVVNEPMGNQPSDWRTYRFAVDIVQEYAAKTTAQAEIDFDKAVDAAMDKLAAQWRLPDNSSVPTVDVSQVTTGQVAVTEMTAGPAIYIQLTVECKTLIS